MTRYHKFAFMAASIFDRFRNYETWKQTLKDCLGTEGHMNRVDSDFRTAARQRDEARVIASTLVFCYSHKPLSSGYL